MKLDIVLEPKQMTSALAYVQNEIGVAILPSSGVPDKLPDSLKAIALTNPNVERNISILRRRGIALSPAASAMRQLLLDAVV